MHENVMKVFKKMNAVPTTTPSTGTTGDDAKCLDKDCNAKDDDQVLFSNEQECTAAMGDAFGMVDNKDWEWPQQPQPPSQTQQQQQQSPHYIGELFIWPAGYGSSTTVVWPQSHINEAPSSSDIPDDEFSEVSQFNAGAVRLMVARGGAMVLYDSRLLRRRWKLGPQFTILV